MHQNYNKLSSALVLAFGMIVDEDFLFQVIVNEKDLKELTQSEIFQLSVLPEIELIDLDRRLDTRRWHDRYTKRDRRNGGLPV